VSLSFLSTLFSFSLKNFFEHFLEDSTPGSKFFSFVCLGNKTPSLLKDDFSGYRILGWCGLFSQHLKNFTPLSSCFYDF
jgi:hypothetical protein